MHKVFLGSVSADESLFELVFQLDILGVCVCALCKLLTPFIPAAVCLFWFGALAHMNVWMCGGVRGRVGSLCRNDLPPLALAVRVYTHWHPVAYVCVHPRGHSVLCVSMRQTLWRALFADKKLCFCPSPWRRGVSSILLCPKPTVRDMVVSEQVSSSPDKWVVQPFNLSGLAGVKDFENIWQEQNVAVEGCSLVVLILDTFVCYRDRKTAALVSDLLYYLTFWC